MKILPFICALALASVSFAQTQTVTNLRFTNSIIAGSTTPGLITGTNGALALAAAGTNQNIALTPSGTGGVAVSTNSATTDPGIYVVNASTTGASMISFRRTDNAVRMQVGFGQSGLGGSPLTSAAFVNVTSGFPLVFAQGSLFATTEMARFAPTTGNLLLGSAVDGSGKLQVTGGVNVATGELMTGGNRVNYNLTVYAAGTAYAFTNADAAIDFGTTDPTVTINKAGTYIIFGRVYAKYNAATFVGNQTLTTKLRRTNNTAADVANSTHVATTRIITTVTDSIGVMPLPPVIYTTTNADDVISLFGSLSAAPSAGSVDATEASIVAVRLY